MTRPLITNKHTSGGGSGLESSPTGHSPRNFCHGEAFSLVEVVIAIGLFAFVIVGILGLFPAALRIRSESALEARSYLVAQQLFSQVAASPNISNVTVRNGPLLGGDQSKIYNLLQKKVVMGYIANSSMPYFLYHKNPDSSWTHANAGDSQVLEQGGSGPNAKPVDMMARLSATNVPGWPNLYQITVQVRAPVSLPLTNTKPVTFVTYQAF
jgi:type II secretory pathway pseudopilin PulG